MKDQQDCVLNDPEELGGTRLFLKNQHNTEIFSCVLPLFVTPMMAKRKMILRIIFYSPEFNRSIIISK